MAHPIAKVALESGGSMNVLHIFASFSNLISWKLCLFILKTKKLMERNSCHEFSSSQSQKVWKDYNNHQSAFCGTRERTTNPHKKSFKNKLEFNFSTFKSQVKTTSFCVTFYLKFCGGLVFQVFSTETKLWCNSSIIL